MNLGDFGWFCKGLSLGQQNSRANLPHEQAREQNLRFQGQYLDRDSSLHYNTFRYYDPDLGRFISPDPIGILGGINLHSYAANPITRIDPWGWMPLANPIIQGHHMAPWQVATHFGIHPFNSQTGVPAMFWDESQWTGLEHRKMHGYNGYGTSTKPIVKPSQLPPDMDAESWMKSLTAHYNNPEIADVRGDLHLLNSDGTKGQLLAANVSPSEAWAQSKAWAENQGGNCRS